MAFFIGILIFFLVRCRSVFYTDFQPEIFLEEYTKFSQGQGFYSDDRLYALAGWMYVHGTSPDKINAAHPPLAKYMIGFSEFAFMNHVMLGLVISVITLTIVYLISRRFLSAFPFALLPTLLLSLDEMYIYFSSVSMLDIYATFFATLSLLLLILSEKRNWAVPLFYVAAGLALSCKWTTVFLLALPPLLHVLRRDWRRLRTYPLYLIIAALTYTATYAAFFLAGNGIQDFIDLQLRMLGIHQERRLEVGTPRPFWILLNFLTGIEGPTKVQILSLNPGNRTITVIGRETGLSLLEWYNPLTWPLSFSASLLALYYMRWNRQIAAMPMGFLLLLASVSVGKPFIWYLLPGLPFAFLSLVFVINSIYMESTNKWARRTILGLYIVSIIVWSVLVDLPPYIKT